jgi:FkbM family methyltransferase
MKVLWHSVHPAVGSGYGQQTATFTPRIKALGHDVAISAYYGVQGFKMSWQGITCYPAYAKSYGSDIIIPHAMDHFGGGPGHSFRDVADKGVIITLGDVWTFEQPLLREMNVAAWVPVDHEEVPPPVAGWFERTGAAPIAMSRFGEKLLRDAGMDPLYVPHGIDTNIFRPGDKAEARERAGLPTDAFVVAMVAANVGKDGSRKAFYEQIVAFGELRRRHSDAVLVLHTDVTSPYGVDIRHLLSDFPDGSYHFTDQYAYKVGLPPTVVADVYRSADVLTNTSWGEGFGIPIVEAQACGTPVVVTDTTAMPELCGAGWKVPGEVLWHDSQSAWARRPLISGIVDAYEQAYESARDEGMRSRAWAFAQDYDADRVLVEFWKPALERLEVALEMRRTDPPPERKPSVREADGLLWLDRGPGYNDQLGFSSHESILTPIIDELLPDGGVLLDVGAHVGHWTLRLAGKASHVHAVEANPDTAATLRRNLAINDITNVTVHEVAAWDEDTTLALDDPNRKKEGGSTRTVPPDAPGQTVVPARSLDSVLAVDRIDLVKLDVEGADLHALRGMSGLLAEHRPVLLIECHDVYGYYTRGDLEQLLADLDYTWEVVHTVPTWWHPDGELSEPAAADYLACRPAPR